MGAICARRRELTIFNFSEALALMLVIIMETCHVPHMFKLNHCRPTVWTWRALSLEFARRHEGFGGMPIASFFRVVDISFEYRGDAVP
jgi:hypothetical protein